MKIKTLCLPLAVAAAIAFACHLPAQTWQTVDDFLYPGGWGGSIQAMARDSSGSIFTAGYTSVGDTVLGLIRKSSDGGATWESTLAFSGGEANRGYEYDAITVDSGGTIYALGNNSWNVGPGPAPHRWIVSRSTDGGQTWATTEANVSAEWDLDERQGIATDGGGNIYAVGGAKPLWTVRKSSDGGDTWTTVDSFNSGFVGGYDRSHATAVLCHPVSGIFVVGYGYAATTAKGNKTTTQRSWYVRRSLDNGVTWATVDSYPGGDANGIGSDSAGNIYVVGGNAGHWIVRRSSNGGGSWATVDDFRNCVTTVTSTKPYRTQTTCSDAWPHGFAADSNGNLFVIGGGGSYLSASGQHWIVRASLGGTGTWQTVDDFQYLTDYGAENQAYGIVADSVGGVFVGGFGTDLSPSPTSSQNYHWLVRKLSAP